MLNRQIIYKPSSNRNPDFNVSYFSVENEIDFFTTANNCFEIIISPARNTIALYENTNGISTISNSIIGLSNSFSKLSLKKNVYGFHIRLSPNQLKLITKIPFHELAKSPIGMDCIFGNSYSNLLDELNDERTITQQIRLIELFFKNYTLNKEADNKTCFLDTLGHEKHNVTVKSLQCMSGMSERNLERYFQVNIGISPAEYLGIEKFNQFACTVSSRKFQSGEFSLLQQALDFGYYDQSHLIRKCKKYSGLTPNKFFQKYNPALSGTYNF